MSGEPTWLTANETLLRQAHPAQMKGPLPSSQVFVPTPDHNFTLSLRRERLGAQRAYEAHLQDKLLTTGTWGVTVDEFRTVDLDAFDDSSQPSMPLCHVSVPFGVYETPTSTKRAHTKKARELKAFAISRGRLYP